MTNIPFRAIFLAIIVLSIWAGGFTAFRPAWAADDRAPGPEEDPSVTAVPKGTDAFGIRTILCPDEKSARLVADQFRWAGSTPTIVPLKDIDGKTWYCVFPGSSTGASPGVVEEEQPVSDGPVEIGEPVEELPVEEALPEEEEVAEEEVFEDEEAGDVYQDIEEPLLDFTCRGFVEFEGWFSTRDDQDSKEANKKNEIRSRFEIRYGTDSIYFYTASDLYLFLIYLNEEAGDDYVYAPDTTVSRNLMISSERSELRFDELYVNYGKANYRLRVGNQIFAWGTADAFNPTSYFNPYDLREFLFKDDDEYRIGVPALSGMLFFEDSTLEVVFVPAHVPMVLAPEENFWSLVIDDYFFPVEIEEPSGLPVKSKNCGFGARLSRSVSGVDFSLSGYHGPDREPVFVPYRTVLRTNEPLSLLIRSFTYTVNMVGVDFTTTYGDFVFQTEAAYSPDKRWIVRQDLDDYANLTLPFEVKKSHYLSYAVGFNYFVPLNRVLDGHEGESVFTFEWFQSKYFDDDLFAPLLTDLITCRYEDSFMSGRVKTKMTGIFDVRNDGYVLWPEIGYDFQNGWTVDLSYAGIRGSGGSDWEDNSIFYYFRDNDILMGRIRYEYYLD
ncbi:MAG: hypothetical protein JXO48_02275 [Deltaproteobacteria bacterium]|nr:hypothetical protein [Deltaproteobacteria bacterium]